MSVDREAPSTGLDPVEAARRLAVFGPNELQQSRDRGLWTIVREALREPMFLLLIATCALYLLLGDLGEGLFLAAGVAAAVGLVILQESRSERALVALRELSQPTASVIRGGIECRVPARELVPGDLLLVAEGLRLPADGRLIGGDVLTVDELALTGESAPVSRQPVVDVDADTSEQAEPGGEGGGRLFAGTLVVQGHGVARVVDTGARTALGRIGASLATTGEELTPLQRTSRRVVGVLGVVAIGFCVVVVAAYGLIRGDWIEGVLAGLTVAISLIPEEFPMVLAVFLALGAWRLARHRVLVRRGAAIEALGGASVLCVDKTGTLTENRMSVAALWVEGRTWRLEPGRPAPPAAAQLLEAAALACAPRPIDPMDRAVRELHGRGDPDGDPPGRIWPLRPDRLAVVQAWRSADGAHSAGAKGAPEAIFRLCRLSPDQIATLELAVGELAASGLRVLGVATRAYGEILPEEPEPATFAFEGLVGFLDPLRDEVPAALAEARAAGVAVVMVTGDYPATALEIARRAGIETTHGVLSGADLDRLSPGELRERVGEVRVFARIRPEQKLQLVEAFKARGEVVAMTGDGVNDAPALEAAHIGVAMGRRGTDVAREAADLVLLDDSFASIIGGIRLGRRIFANLRKALTYITAIHVPIAGLALAPVMLGLPPLLFPVHVVLLELVIDPVCSLVFESEPSEASAMQRKPRRRDEPLFGPRHIALAVLQGLIVLASVFGIYLHGLQTASEAEARGAAFMTLVLANLVLAAADAFTPGVKVADPRHGPLGLIAVVAVSVVAAILLVPALSAIFYMSLPAADLAAQAVGAGVVAGGWYGFIRALRPRAAPLAPAASG